ncbi:YchJ family protein [Methylotenera sp.]|uniref:YchJ family protein n=1 Tax=Methylotenera sp. TaxID=2051956 RepID=UPI002724D0B4|nr:YchJ family metal-binding protein [Methylotenera sp.]MDO9206325.1 YchJ family metal-binding protein [Methylotenera sp.]MDO9392879.1 YchJ family metal-binding protein [Methylotenera sp.]MDP1522783.1 YchJ family metal-binding protein [Methylotenera sp.]MDP2071968.1 YchJ family metal-binding protein [Methylotenera sp.]MDP3007023.1 YchJ family metal-binding protein [Methylotenera sp.]
MKSSKSSAKSTTQELCRCESKKPYSACCEAYHHGLAAPTAEALMRSRYTAYVLGLENYLSKTWHPATRPASLNLTEDPTIKWLGLQIKYMEITGETTATVEFVARYKIAGKAERLHEISQFVCLEGCWYYLTGTYPG